MKKLYLAIITLALATVLVTGCGDKTGNFQSDSYTETRSKSNRRTSNPDTGDESEINSQNDKDYQDNEGSQSGSRTKTRSRSDKDTTSGPDIGRLFKKKPKVKIDDYFRYVCRQEDTERKHPVSIEFDLEGYLTAYGATKIQYLGEIKYQGADGRSIMYGAKFENNIVLLMLFRQRLSYDDYYCEYDLTNITISACNPDYDFTSFDNIDYASIQDVEGLTSWSREYYIDEMEVTDGENMSKKYDWLSILLIDKFYDNDKSFYSDGPAKTGRYLLVPIDFDSIFRKLVAPYLNLRKVSLKSDPFEDKDF